MNRDPKCCGCEYVRGTPYGGLGVKRCMRDPLRRDVSDYYHISPSDGLPLASHLSEPRPDWCPRLPSLCPASIEPEKPDTWRHLVAYVVLSGERQAA